MFNLISRTVRGAGLAATLALITLSGCGGKEGPSVEGSLLFNGAPYQFGADEQMQITFVGAEGGLTARTLSATVQNDAATFRVQGEGEAALAPGKYRIAVHSMRYGPGLSPADKFRGAFSPGKTPLEVEVGADDQRITIDLGKRTVTRN